jgi:hypothetical protein
MPNRPRYSCRSTSCSTERADAHGHADGIDLIMPTEIRPAPHLSSRPHCTQDREGGLCPHWPCVEHPGEDRQALVGVGYLPERLGAQITGDPREELIARRRFGVDPYRTKQNIEQCDDDGPSERAELRQIDDSGRTAVEQALLEPQHRLGASRVGARASRNAQRGQRSGGK